MLNWIEYNDKLEHPNNLYLWQGNSVTKYESELRLDGLIQLNGNYYFWQYDGIYQYWLDRDESQLLFSLKEGKTVTCFWGYGETLYVIEGPYDSEMRGYTICRYELQTGRLYREDWLSDCRDGKLYFYAVVENELLVRSLEEKSIFWLNLRDGSRRECDIQGGRPYGYRDGSIALYRAGESTITLHDVQTCHETTIPVLEEILSAEDPGDYTLLTVGEDAAYWLEDGHTFYKQTDDAFEPFFSYTGRVLSEAYPYDQLIGDTFYFAYSGRPAEGFAVYDLRAEIPERETITFGALTPDGEVYLLAEESFPSPTA